MMRPANFMFNMETAVTNHYQVVLFVNQPIPLYVICLQDESSRVQDLQTLQKTVLEEFDAAVNDLKENGVRVTVFQDTVYHVKPDAIFPNNWISVHHSGEIVLYPMATANRRLERRMDLISWLEVRVLTTVKLSYLSCFTEYFQNQRSFKFDTS